ncbi:MAG: TonB-dependent receptor [Bacteroidetes bacterium]|nr:MAG: TonB-dependent receptor [Bacteroidota bacterium]
MKRIGILIISFLILRGDLFGQNQTNKSGDTTVSFKVFGVCDQCKKRIEGSLKANGVESAEWNIDTKILNVSYIPSKITLEKIVKKITAAGHDNYYKKAKDADYYALPKCCYYRDLQSMESMNTKTADSSATPDPSQMDLHSNSNQVIKGVVLEETSNGSFKPLSGASVIWLGTNKGTLTGVDGVFNLKLDGERLVISYSGFTSDTVSISPDKEVKIILASGKQLKEVRVTATRPSTYINRLDVVRTQTITQKELFRAACCNLSESFETNPSVDVSYNDAVTGSKQIQLLGLAGIYAQLTVENMPGPRGLATAMGLNSIPGPWIESIQLSKGTGSVANGFESIAGQINVELKKPATSEKLFANVYTNNFGKTDFNLNASQKIGKRWSTELLFHDDFLNRIVDENKDGFRDLPTGNLLTLENKWGFDNNKGLMSQFGLRLLHDERTGGQVDYDPSKDKFTTNSYGLGINTRRYEAFGKLGYVFPEKKYKSIGLQVSAFDHSQHSYFGLTNYDAHQQNFYSNLIYQSIIHSTINKFRTGLSFVYDRYNEDFKSENYKRNEIVSGAFFEYTYTPSTKFDAVLGLRGDHNNLYGWFFTPRLNLRYEPIKNTIFRISVGKGQRTANIFAENNSVFVSSRAVEILNAHSKGAYGLQPEIAWNKGITMDQKFKLFNREASLGLDFFRNDFVNQVVADLEDPRKIQFYNLQGKSYSNSFQTEFSFQPLTRVELKLAYRWFDVKTTYSGQLLQRPLTSRDRAFGNLNYSVSGWKFDYTVTYSGRKRIPSTTANPPQYQRPDYSPSFVMMNAQVSKTFGKKNSFEVYLGGENLTSYIQKDAIISAEEPFGPYFDASLVWGSLTGRMIYGGLRLTIK